MYKIKYFFNRIFKIDYKRFVRELKNIKKDSKKSYVFLLFDILRCGIKYNSGYMDYKIAKMYNLNSLQRSTTITRGISNLIVSKLNNKKYWYFFDNKAIFNREFKKYIKRDWLEINKNTDDSLIKNFLKYNKSFIYKPINGSSGQGIKIYYEKDYIKDMNKFIHNILKTNNCIIEELVVQHHLLNLMYPDTVNTIRVATLLGEKRQGIVYAFLRIGNGNKNVDNVDCGGMAARIDLDTGKIITPAADKSGGVYYEHPITKYKILDFVIPYWKEIKNDCIEASKKYEEMKYVAWDIAVTENGPLFIEGNSFPSHAIPQFSTHYKDGIGILSEFRKFIDI